MTYYTEEEVQRYTRLLARAWDHLKHGSASDLACMNLAGDIRNALGWRHDKMPDHSEPWEDVAARAIAAALALEREACLKLVRQHGGLGSTADVIEQAIRARGKTE